MLIWDRQELEILGHLTRWPDSNLSFSDIYTHPTFLQVFLSFPKHTLTFPPPGLCPHCILCRDYCSSFSIYFLHFCFFKAKFLGHLLQNMSNFPANCFLYPLSFHCLLPSLDNEHCHWKSCSVPSLVPDTVSSLHVSACIHMGL